MKTALTPNTASLAERARVLVVEDEPDLREAIVAYLTLEAIDAVGVGSLADAQAWRDQHDFDILILDLGLPDGDGLRWLEALPALDQRGVLVLTARGAPAQRIVGLRAGADAYLVKPVALEELSLHVRKLFARIHTSQIQASGTAIAASSSLSRSASWQLNAKTWVLTAPNGKTLLLKNAERLLLQALLSPAGEVLSKERVVESQGGNPDGFDYRRIETLVRRLRIRCRESLDAELPVQTIYGRGLAFTETGAVVHDTDLTGGSRRR